MRLGLSVPAALAATALFWLTAGTAEAGASSFAHTSAGVAAFPDAVSVSAGSGLVRFGASDLGIDLGAEAHIGLTACGGVPFGLAVHARGLKHLTRESPLYVGLGGSLYGFVDCGSYGMADGVFGIANRQQATTAPGLERRAHWFVQGRVSLGTELSGDGLAYGGGVTVGLRTPARRLR